MKQEAGTSSSVDAQARLDSFTTIPAAGSKNSIFFLTAIYVTLTALTQATFQGDTPYYALSIVNYSGGRDFLFWDFGHLLWRPALWTLLHISHPLLPSVSAISLVFKLMTISNWAAGLGCVLLLERVARRFVSASLAFLGALTLVLSQVFLNYLHTGTAYVPGLFFLLVGFYFSSANPDIETNWRRSAALGLPLAVAVLLWLPYIFALPALFLFRLVIYGFNRESFLYTLRAVLVCALVGLGVYSVVAIKLGLSTAADLKEWITLASHSSDHLGGLARATFGFVRSWLEMGNLGIDFRRFLLHDPYAPVSMISLLFAGTWKLILIYACLASIAFRLLAGSTPDRRMLVFLVLAFLPVFGFGVKWQGGDMERYLAAFPALLLSGVYAMNSRSSTIVRTLGLSFLLALILVNLSYNLRWVESGKQRALAARADALGTIPEKSYVVFFPADPLFSFISFASIIPDTQRQVRPLEPGWVLTIGSKRATQWPQDFASNSLRSWRDGKEVWICRGLLEQVPQRKWGWTEGAEPSVRWKDIYAFFSQLQTSEVRGDFVQVPPTEANTRWLNGIVNQSVGSKSSQ